MKRASALGAVCLLVLEIAACDSPTPAPLDAGGDAAPLIAQDAAEPTHDGAAEETSLAAFMRSSPTVHASARLEARVGGMRACVDMAGRSCLTTPCDHAAGCVYFGELSYESTPSTGTSGPPLTIRAQYFQLAPLGELPGHARVMELNHGGTSIGEETTAFALRALTHDYAVVMSTYRGSGGADGAVEGCLGEGDDARLLAVLVREAAPSDPLVMVGGSHGGCVTLRALLDGAPVDAAVALWPGTDGARRYRYNHALIAADGPLTSARDACAGGASPCCDAVRRDHAFVADGLVAPSDALGVLPDWETRAYACDDPAFAAMPSPWIGLEDREPWFCDRSPLARASSLATAYAGPLLVIHGERDPFIHHDESCELARQAGGFAVHRIDDRGEHVAPGGESPCPLVPITAGDDPSWAGTRHLLLIEPLGHGDSGRASSTDSCDATMVAMPDLEAELYAFLEAKLAAGS